MFKKILCKLGFHKYNMKRYMLTSSIATIVKCENCGCDLAEETRKKWKKKREKILNTKLP
jgi:hypothetical protein